MKKISFVLATVCMLSSCQRELDDMILDNEQGLLVKVVEVSASSGFTATNTTSYEYDANRQLVSVMRDGTAENIRRSSQAIYTRDAGGRIVEVHNYFTRLKDGTPWPTPEGPAWDTTQQRIVYQDENSRLVAYIISTNRHGNETSTDSTVFEYGSNGLPAKSTGYFLPMGIHLPGETMQLYGYRAFSFDAQNRLLQLEEYSWQNNAFSLQIRYRFAYDSKTNPLYRLQDGLFSDWFNISPNNVITQSVYIPVTGEQYDNTVSFTYRTDGKPATAEYFSPPTVVSGTRSSTFYYK